MKLISKKTSSTSQIEEPRHKINIIKFKTHFIQTNWNKLTIFEKAPGSKYNKFIAFVKKYSFSTIFSSL